MTDKSTVLIIDDEPSSIDILVNLLKDLYKIKVTKSAENVVDTIKKSLKPDVILLDIMMPDIDGFSVIRDLKNDKETKDIPVIFISSLEEDLEITKGLSLGAADYVTKPFRSEELKARIENHLQRYKLQKEREHYLELVDQYVITSSTDLAGKITYVSEAFCNISGYSKEELLNRNHSIVKHPDMKEELFREIWDTIKQNKTWRGEIKNRKKDGQAYWVDASISPVFDDYGNKVGYTAIRQDITDKKRIEELSITDELTEIYNRRYFNKLFPKIINSAKRKNELVSFLIMDIDHFKQYNDTYGHQMGDNTLKKVAQSIKDSLKRASDYPFRLGGEEFGIIFNVDDKEKALKFAERIRESIESLSIKHHGNSASDYVTASLGLVCKKANDISNMDAIYKEADDLLYRAKKAGRNRVEIGGL